MSRIERHRKLYDKLSTACEGHPLTTVGTALSTLCIDVAMFVGMPKDFFLDMMTKAWDVAEEERVEMEKAVAEAQVAIEASDGVKH